MAGSSSADFVSLGFLCLGVVTFGGGGAVVVVEFDDVTLLAAAELIVDVSIFVFIVTVVDNVGAEDVIVVVATVTLLTFCSILDGDDVLDAVLTSDDV